MIKIVIEFIFVAICPLPFYDRYINVEFHYNTGDGWKIETVQSFMNDWLFGLMFIRLLYL